MGLRGESQKSRFGDQSGSTLIAVLGAIAILGLLSVTVWKSVEQRGAAYAAGRYASQRSSLALRLRREVRAGLNLYSSLRPAYRIANDPLYRCLLEHVSDPDGDCQAGTWYPLTLVSDDDRLLAGPSSQNPAKYSFGGNFCQGRTCAFAVWAEFQATCQGHTASCSVAQALVVRLHILTAPDASARTFAEKIFTEYVPIADPQFGGSSYVGFDLKSLPAAPSIGPTVLVDSSSDGLGPSPNGGGGTSAPAPPPPPPPKFSSCGFGQITGGGSCGSFFL